MSDFGVQSQDFNHVTISPWSTESIGTEINAYGNNPATTAYPTANLGIFIPFTVYQPLTAVKMFTVNGATATGNVDIGIYDSGQNRLVSMGSTAQSGTSAVQTYDITDTLLQPGVYYMAISQSGTSGTFFAAVPAIALCSSMGVLSQAIGAVTLPNPATFATMTAAYVPCFGLTARTTV